MAEQVRPVVAQVLVGKPLRQQTQDHQRAEQRVHDGVVEAQCAAPLTGHLYRAGDLGPRGFANVTIVADAFDVQETSVGVKADPPQRGEVLQPFADAEVARVLIVVSVRSARPSLWYCLMRLRL